MLLKEEAFRFLLWDFKNEINFHSHLSWKFSWMPSHKWSPLFQWTCMNKGELPTTKGSTIVHCRPRDMVHGSNLNWNRCMYKLCCLHFIPTCNPCFIPSLQSMFYTDCFLIILVILVILAIQVITIFLEKTIAPYQCRQSYLTSSTTCSKVSIKISSRKQFVTWIITIRLPFW